MTLLKKSVGSQRAVIPSSGTYNSIVDSLNRGGIRPANGFRRGNGLCVSVLNVGDHSITPGRPVAFNNLETESWPSSQLAVVPGRWYSDISATLQAYNPPWGIAQEPIAPGCIGDVLVSGHAFVNLSASHYYDRLPKYVAPDISTGGYRFASSGTCRVLAASHLIVLCALNAGGDGEATNDYAGDFRLELQPSSANLLVMHGGTVHIGLDKKTVGGYYPAIVEGTHYCKLVVVWGGPSHPNSWTYRWEDSTFENMSYLEWQKVLASYEVSNVAGVLYVTKVNQLWSNGSLVLSGRVV